MNALTLSCPKCGKETHLDPEAQKGILARLSVAPQTRTSSIAPAGASNGY